MRVYRGLPIHPGTHSYILPLAHFDAAILCLCLRHISAFSSCQSLFLLRCWPVGTRLLCFSVHAQGWVPSGSIAQGRVPGLSVRPFQYNVLSAAVRRYVHQAMVGGAGQPLVQPELGLGGRVEFCQREKEAKCDRVLSCPPRRACDSRHLVPGFSCPWVRTKHYLL